MKMKKKSCHIFHSTHEAKFCSKNGTALTIGNFDGVHLGHRAIIQSLTSQAIKLNLTSCLLTFDPHPVKILSPQVAPKCINTTKQKKELLSTTGLDIIVLQKFDKSFSKAKPEYFFSKYLVEDLNAQYISVGYDFTFGEKRLGTIETLEILCYKNNIPVKIIDAKMLNNTLISSTVIRKLIREGQISPANKLLSRAFFIDGTVTHGYHRGTSLGIHTANLKTENELIPGDGVYATFVEWNHKIYDSVTNIGFNPTFDNTDRSIETHILNFDQDIYQSELRLIFIEKLRDEIRFATPSALVTQIEKDIIKANDILKLVNRKF